MVKLSRILSSFRSTFTFPQKDVLHWFPGHMGKGIKQMKQQLKNVDCIIEVHDARIPISGRNRTFKTIFGDLKPHILVLNKKDLADLRKKDDIILQTKKEGFSEVLFTNCKAWESTDFGDLIPVAQKLILNSDRFNRSDKKDYVIMVTGVPNVGKSSLINSLRHKYLKKSKAVAVGGVAGITRSVTSRIKVSEVPLIYVLDTPGILEPSVPEIETGFKLALCSAMLDHLVGPTNIADYLLFWLNKNNNLKYVDCLKLKNPTDQIMELLMLTAIELNKTQKRRNAEGGYSILPDIEYAANHFIRAFREGDFGKVMLDEQFK